MVKAKTFLPSFCSSPYDLGSHAQRLKENKHTNKHSKTKEEPRLVLNRSCTQSRVSKSRLLCPVRFWVFPRTQTSQPLWQPVWSPSWCTIKTNINNERKTKEKQPRTTQNTFLYPNHNFCISTCAHCLLPCQQTPLSRAWLPLLPRWVLTYTGTTPCPRSSPGCPAPALSLARCISCFKPLITSVISGPPQSQ